MAGRSEKWLVFGIDFKGRQPAGPVDPAELPGRRRAALLVLTLCTVLWGLNVVASKIAVRDITPAAYLLARFSLAAAVVLALAIWRRRVFSWVAFRRGIPAGLALAAVVYTGLLGVAGTSAIRAGVLYNLFIVIIPCLSWLVWRERPERATLAAVACGGCGLWLLGSGQGGLTAGDLFALLSAVTIAGHTLIVERSMRGADVLVSTLAQFVVVALVGLAVVAAQGGAMGTLTAPAALAVGFGALFPAALALTLQNKFQKRISATEAGIIYALDPVWTVLGAALFLRERPTPTEWLGCGWLFAGALLLPLVSVWRERRRRILARGAMHQRDPSEVLT